MTGNSPQTILLVEDQTPLRRLMSRMLARRGFEILEARNGFQAISLYERIRGAIDLTIVDMVMPQMSGLDLAAELGRRDPQLKILYMSGCVGSIVIESLLQRSPEFVLLKPFTEECLLERVSNLLNPEPPVLTARSAD